MTDPTNEAKVTTEEMVKHFDSETSAWFHQSKCVICQSIRATVLDHPKVKAENEGLRVEFATLKKAYDDECAWRGRGYRDLLARAEKAEAELERARPWQVSAGGKEIGVATITRDDKVSVVFFRLVEPLPAGQKIPGMMAGLALPDDQILFELAIPKAEFCMTFANVFCNAWQMLTDKESTHD